MIFIDIFAAFFIAVLAGMGVGSGGLLVIYLTTITGMNQLEAQGLNLAFFLIASSASLIIHFFKRKMRMDLIIIMSIFGIIGAVIGSLSVSFIPSSLLSKIFGAFLITSGIIALFKRA